MPKSMQIIKFTYVYLLKTIKFSRRRVPIFFTILSIQDGVNKSAER